ncbi:MAG: VCBS repeat-containing protein, partial [Verrucomicrobiales bacterium]
MDKSGYFVMLFLGLGVLSGNAALPFERQVIDAKISIGYGLAIGDVDGDKKPDILLADKSQVAWYRNGDWQRFVMTENINPRVGTRFLDNVCIAARDIDGDGKVEVAVGANWNPGETSDKAKSGSVHILKRPDDPTKRWGSKKLDHHPTVHRMHFVQSGKGFELLVLPLHGVGNKGGAGDAVKLLHYAASDWKMVTHDIGLHATHNFD